MKILANRAIELLAIGLILAPNMMADEEKLSLTLRSRTKGAPKNFVEKKIENIKRKNVFQFVSSKERRDLQENRVPQRYREDHLRKK